MEKQKNLPRHLGIILDGNRRWAKEHGLPTFEGHRKGFENVKLIIQAAQDRGIKTLTLFCFSTENWHRSKEEVDYLMDIFRKSLSDYSEKFNKKNVKVSILGQKEKFARDIKERIEKIESETKNNTGMTLNLALSYGGRAELVDAIKKIVKKGIDPDKITEDTVKDNLWTSDVDLIIRTGGEQRLSGFLLWQAAYSEFLFVKKYWPDFGENDLDAALAEYASRQRRFGR
ncbi:MAG: polyprenyl diphosphate synthase [Minisyncoccales bacterium]